jgi:hypothetical protein
MRGSASPEARNYTRFASLNELGLASAWSGFVSHGLGGSCLSSLKPLA